ncbi:hypothetical protein [Sphingobacterium paucimobilis]|uniref:Uncharacterized protein n=1 Tax=Sphingobacterium paucimobilis HER1398 TaxID=1346330 RepID=U2HQ40_9SPHI|nr:hypothetical protein [Sphingobacterium paucimobilis]ERJ57410.1 hypothetical protein M472_01385 [Sphingobacterium paucimobilis HER1398]
MSEKESPYQLFTREILSMWTSQDVSYIKVEELSNIDGTTFYELIPDSELLDGGGHDTLYPIDSEDVDDMLLPNKKIKFVVHSVYLEEDE